ncbi:MAG: cytochrome c3 family protein [Armatimonadota bacterium]|nr:cytochrome c3 family protein [Armatimonadota bacterium]MDR7450512.1 cytochrome c3 family protein [Armatimonadota bacterium]MDR7466355.1 cytochrome c3 family protein [Armatimonadota bacterium]MDR7493076.1 cytochrome c3 family protein [Armatimonadota bacterium]MDR7498167.1 cytochrome c3 family protein [Armatimonadota bacterium]
MNSARSGGWRQRWRTVWARLTDLPRGWLIALVAAAASSAALLVYGGVTVYDYTMNNPAFCRSCHTMEAAWNRWATSEHRKVDCHACHEQSVIESARQVITFALRRPERVGKHAVVPSARCATCHTSGNPAWKQVAATAGHQVHAEVRKIACVTCHSVAIHRLVRPPEVCGTCHEAQVAGPRAIKIAAMADFHCVDCHQFLRPNSPLRPTAQTCLECHQALPAKTTVGWPEGRAHSALSCAACHRPHERAAPIVNCTSCHAAPTPEIHAPILRSRTACTTCHQPHYWKVR